MAQKQILIKRDNSDMLLAYTEREMFVWHWHINIPGTLNHYNYLVYIRSQEEMIACELD